MPRDAARVLILGLLCAACDGGAGDASGGGTGGADGDAGGVVPPLPAAPADCPEIKTGSVSVLGTEAQLWVGPANTPGPIVFYWYGVSSSSAEAAFGLGAGLSEIQASGGVLVAFKNSTGRGDDTGGAVWYTGDFALADAIVACAVEQGVADPRRIYSAGCSAGGIQASVMAYARSSYVAAVMPNSGGTLFEYTLEDPNHAPAVISAHGGPEDKSLVSFSETTAHFDSDIAEKGGFVVDCDHGSLHCASSAAVKNAQWRFLKAHPFGTSPSPYANGLPADFPPICRIVR